MTVLVNPARSDKVAAMTPPKLEQAMDSLPTANPDLTQFFRQWLETFAGYVREVDYAAARPLFHPDVLAFGTHNDVIPGLDKSRRNGTKSGRRPPTSVSSLSRPRFWRHPIA